MKRKIFILYIIVAILMLFSACSTQGYSKGGLTIVGEQTLELGFEYEYIAKLNGKEIKTDEVYWIVNNDNVQLVNNKIIPLSEGTAKLTAILKEDGNKYCILELNVISALVDSISLHANSKELKIGSQMVIEYRTIPSEVTEVVKWSSSDENIAKVDSGIVTGVDAGNVTITAKCGSAVATYELKIVKEITEIELYTPLVLSKYSTVYLEFNIDDPIINVEDSNSIVEENYLFAVKEGNTTISVTSKSNSKLKARFTFSISDKLNNKEISEEETAQIDKIMETLSPEQKVGQLFMFNININGLKIDENGLYFSGYYGDKNRYYISEQLGGRSIGNLYISPQNTTKGNYNGNSAETLKNLVLGYQTYILEQTGIGALVITDASEQAYSYTSLTNYFSDYLSNIELGTIGDLNSTKTNFDIMSIEVHNLGINMLIYNAFMRSTSTYGIFSDLIDKQCINSKLLFDAFKNKNITVSPYFGSNDVESNTQLLKAAINSGVEVIDVYNGNNFYNIYNETIQSHLRKNGFNGLIIDSNTIYPSNHEGYESSFYDAIMSGIDMLYITMTNNTWSGTNTRMLNAYDYLVSCAEDGRLPEERLNEAVRRVLLQKIRNGAIDGTFPTDNFGNNGSNQSTINSLVNNQNTYYTSKEFTGLDKSKKTYAFSSPYVKYTYNTQSDQYNFTATMFLNAKKNGYSEVVIANFDSQYLNKIETITKDDQVVVVMYDDIILYYDYVDEDGEVQYYFTDWQEIVKLLSEKTDNIVLVFMNDSSFANDFAEYDYVKIFANYSYDYNFTDLIKVLDDGKTKGKKLNER